MSSFCSSYALQSSIPKNEGTKNVILLSGSPCIGRKCHSFVSPKIYVQCKGRIFGRFPLDMWNYSAKICTSKVFATAQSNAKKEASNFKGQYQGCSFLFRTELGGLVKVFVESNDIKYTAHVEVESLSQPNSNANLILCWGMFRADSLKLYGPDSQILGFSADDVKMEPSQHPMKTPFSWNSLGKLMVVLEFDYIHLPFYLSFLLQPDGSSVESGIRTHRKANFCVPVGLGRGYAMPLGFYLSNNGSANFSLFSRNAESVVLCLYDGKTSEPSLEIELDPYVNRTGDIWHASIDNIANYAYYGYRCRGKKLGDRRQELNGRQVLLDPYARMIKNLVLDQCESASTVKCLGCLLKEPTFHWNGDTHPQIPMEQLVVYRLNVGQFTNNKSSGLATNLLGTFAGVSKKMQHFLTLGINAVLLEPIFFFDKKSGPYFPYNFFSLMNSFKDIDENKSAAYSMKEMVKALHAHGIEVLLEVAFTSTCEGTGPESQAVSFRGIDESSYYIVDRMLDSETSRALKCNDPIVQQMIMDSLHYWVAEFHVDGFCFIDSSSLLQGPNREPLSRPPLVEAIALDPLLSKTKIISDCWSPHDLTNNDVVFPHWNRWAEMNRKFFQDVRNFLRGEGLLSDLATRLCGSGDIFKSPRGPAYSFNYITKNVGLTLVDLVSFSENSTEHASELSWNCGEEGPTDKDSVLEIRLRQVRNFLFILFISLGVPVLTMGDECGYSTGGLPSYSNRVPFDWRNHSSGYGIQMTKFIAFLSSLRNRRSDVFQRREFQKVENITWHGSNQSLPKWEDPSIKFLALVLKGEKDVASLDSQGRHLYISFNAGDLLETTTLPELPEGYIWLRLVDTSLPYPGFFSSECDPSAHRSEGLSSYGLKPHTCALFEAKALKN